MSDDQSPRPAEERLFTDQLRAAARPGEPAFSAALHERIMGAIQTAGSQAPALEPARSRQSAHPLRRWLALAAALLVALIIARRIHERHSPAPTPPGPDRAASGDEWTLYDVSPIQVDFNSDSSPSDRGLLWEGMNHSAKATMQLVLDQSPIEIPSDLWAADDDR